MRAPQARTAVGTPPKPSPHRAAEAIRPGTDGPVVSTASIPAPSAAGNRSRPSRGARSASGPLTAVPTTLAAPSTSRTTPITAGSAPDRSCAAGRTYVKPPKCPVNTSRTARSPPSTRGRRATAPSAPTPVTEPGGMRGRVTACTTSASTAAAAPSRNTPRQPQASPSQVPSGTAATVARETPELTTVSARPTRSAGTRRDATAAAIAQNPPSATPSSTRAASSTGRFGATTTTRSDTAASSVRPIMTRRRSARGRTVAIVSADSAAAAAVTLTACPAWPVGTSRSAAIRGSRLAGRNSDMTIAKIPSPSATTPAQDAGWPAGGAPVAVGPAAVLTTAAPRSRPGTCRSVPRGPTSPTGRRTAPSPRPGGRRRTAPSCPSRSCRARSR